MYRVVTKQILPARQELCTPKRLPHQQGRLPSRDQGRAVRRGYRAEALNGLWSSRASSHPRAGCVESP